MLITVNLTAHITGGACPGKINRYDRQKEIRIEANPEDKLLGEVLIAVKAAVKKLQLYPGYSALVQDNLRQNHSQIFCRHLHLLLFFFI